MYIGCFEVLRRCRSREKRRKEELQQAVKKATISRRAQYSGDLRNNPSGAADEPGSAEKKFETSILRVKMQKTRFR